MTLTTFRSAIALLSVAAALFFLYGFFKIANDYQWVMTTEINFGEANGAPVIGQLWIPLSLCIVFAAAFSLIVWRQALRIFRPSDLGKLSKESAHAE